MNTIGLIVNLVVCMCGTFGLKGTDGETTLKKANSPSAKTISLARAKLSLSYLKPAMNKIHILVTGGIMKQYESREIGPDVTWSVK